MNVLGPIRTAVSAALPGRRGLASGVAAVVVVPLLVVAARGDGFPSSRVDLSGGGAGAGGARRGSVTSTSRASEQVVGSVKVPAAKPGEGLLAVQAGSSAYVVNDAQGAVARVDGATYETTAPVLFGEPGSGALGVYTGSGALYIVDGQRRLAS